MSVLEVLTFPDPRLRKLSEPVKAVDEELVAFSKDLLDTMYEERGIGLSAPQVNRLLRVITVDTRPTDKEGRYEAHEMTELEQKLTYPLVLFNPEIIEKEGETTFDEGCLSVPGYYETVKRFEKIQVKALNRDNEEVAFEVDGLTSICIQHEIDHLDGKLFIDRLSLIKSNRIKSKIKKFGYPSKDQDSDEGSKKD
jgi:peptide deformylase